MKKNFVKFLSVLLSVLIISSFLNGCVSSTQKTESKESSETSIAGTDAIITSDNVTIDDEKIAKSFSTLNDPELMQYIEDSVYSQLSLDLGSEDYSIKAVNTAYLSQEYVDEMIANSRENTYFGYTASELNQQFGDKKYVFTLGDDGKTTVKEFEPYDDTMDKIITNVAIGTGVILVCVVVAVVTYGASVPATVSAIFASAAKTGTAMALSSGVISGATAGIVTGMETGDFEQSMKAAALSGSESFKWGAITGVVTGGLSKAISVTKSIPTPQQSEEMVANLYKGTSQVSYLNGKEVPQFTAGATRPDVIRMTKKGLEAIEVKNYNLLSKNNVSSLCSELKRQVSNRVVNLPKGSTQRIVLDATGRQYTKNFTRAIVYKIQNFIDPVYKDIPIDVIGAI